jgi:CubicO group peptidase (beta-lactamase class C family)
VGTFSFARLLARVCGVLIAWAGFAVAAPPTSPDSADFAEYFPPPESQGGWRKLESSEAARRVAGMEPVRLAELKDWLLKSDGRRFAAVVIRHGYIVLEVERGNSAKTDSRRVASVSKAVCATVLAIASEQSQRGLTPRKMTFDDPAFDFIPWAHPLSDPRKARITVKQLLNHTSGLCPEAIGAPNEGTWQYVLGLSGDPRTAKLAFDPGTGCGYSTHALDHAALVCETVTGRPYDEFAIEALFALTLNTVAVRPTLHLRCGIRAVKSRHSFEEVRQISIAAWRLRRFGLRTFGLPLPSTTAVPAAAPPSGFPVNWPRRPLVLVRDHSGVGQCTNRSAGGPLFRRPRRSRWRCGRADASA